MHYALRFEICKNMHYMQIENKQTESVFSCIIHYDMPKKYMHLHKNPISITYSHITRLKCVIDSKKWVQPSLGTELNSFKI